MNSFIKVNFTFGMRTGEKNGYESKDENISHLKQV